MGPYGSTTAGLRCPQRNFLHSFTPSPQPNWSVSLRSPKVEGHRVYLSAVDLIDGTPVLDIKPYVPYCDAFPNSRAGWVDEVDE